MLTRRALVFGTPFVVSGCVSSSLPLQTRVASSPAVSPEYVSMYAAIDSDHFPIPAIDIEEIDPRFYRQAVAYSGPEAPGTIVVDTANHFLFLVRESGRALRYGVGVGKAGLEFTGTATIQYKREWPRWIPTPDMIRREPDRYAKLTAGMEGGPANPLGARALYLFKDGQDTLYRLHGTVEPWSIGKSMSSGCIRLLNQDIVDLYGRVPTGSKVVVLDHKVRA